MNTCQRKKQSYNHLSNISFSPFYTVSEYNQRRTVKLFDCDLSSSRNQTLQPFSIKGPLEVWSDFFLYTILETLLGPSENVLNVWFCDVCDWYTCGKLNWRDPLGHHPTLWYILQYELWIDFIYTTQETKMLNGNGICCVWGEMTLTQNKERYNKHQQQLPSFSGLFQLRDCLSKLQIWNTAICLSYTSFCSTMPFSDFGKIWFYPLDFKRSVFFRILLSLLLH